MLQNNNQQNIRVCTLENLSSVYERVLTEFLTYMYVIYEEEM